MRSPKHPISDEWVLRVQAATRDLIKACGGLKRAEKIAGVTDSHLSRCQTSDAEGSIIGLPQALALEADCGLPLVTAAMADLQGQTLSSADASRAVETVRARKNELMLATLKTSIAIDEALEDNDLTPVECDLLDREVGSLGRVVSELRRDLATGKARGGLKAVGEAS